MYNILIYFPSPMKTNGVLIGISERDLRSICDK